MYKALEIDFPIPDVLQEDIDAFLDDLNNKGGRFADCYESEIRSILNSCKDSFSELTPEQDEVLRNYYVRGGIYDSIH